MQIIKKVLIKQIVTEKSKEKLRNSFNDHKMRLEQECQQLRFEQRKLENKRSMSKQELSQRFQQENKKLNWSILKSNNWTSLKTAVKLRKKKLKLLLRSTKVRIGIKLWKSRQLL